MRLNEFDDTLQSISLFKIADGLGMPRKTALAVAEHLEKRGFICCSSGKPMTILDEPSQGEGDADIEVSITHLGIEEAERICRPMWRRVFGEPTLYIGVIAAVISSLLAVFVVEALKHRFWPAP